MCLLDIGPDSISTEKPIGFDVLKTVKSRLDAYDPDGTKTIWMKNSEIGHYWMARELTDITVLEEERKIKLSTQFPTANFTMSIAISNKSPIRHIKTKGWDLREVHSRRDFQRDTFLREGTQTFVAIDLEIGETELTLTV